MAAELVLLAKGHLERLSPVVIEFLPKVCDLGLKVLSLSQEGRRIA